VIGVTLRLDSTGRVERFDAVWRGCLSVGANDGQRTRTNALHKLAALPERMPVKPPRSESSLPLDAAPA
jgi:hypothetical protein